MCNHALATANENREVLPSNVKPQHYLLELEPLFDTFKYNGHVTIDIDIKETSDFITCHSLDLDLLESHVAFNNSIVKPIGVEKNEETQTVTFKFEKAFEANSQIKLYIKFVGELNDKLVGFYRSSYEENGKTKYMAATQMEATDCRRAFPCFDEPNLKAKFTISLIGDKSLTFLSNMDVNHEVDVSDTKKVVHFNPTPPMSTYLVAFIVGELKYVESTHKFRDIPIRVYTTPGHESEGIYACEVAAKSLEYYERVFDIKYPLPKMDMVAIPDFSAGAMENWGLVTYRTIFLLFDEAKSTLHTKLRVFEVVAHELAHQWFGNICTMDFWDSLWLNESFATYMTWKCIDHYEKSWKVWEHFVNDSLQMAFDLDGLRSSHPIEVPVKRADEIAQIFDAISYQKGSSVLRMLADWLGEEDFFKGVSHYLVKHAYANATTKDLWDSLSYVSGKDVASTMNVWTNKVGYPLVTVKENGGKINVEQHRFLTSGDVKPEDDETIYPIFLGLKTKETLNKLLTFNKRMTELPVSSTDFVKLNGNTTGVFRVSYEDDRWKKLGQQPLKLSVEDRIGLVADAGALSVSGFSKTSNLLSLVSSWKGEPSFFVWNEIISRLTALKEAWLFEEEEITNGLKMFINDLVVEKCHQIGWEFSNGESFLDQRMKTLLFDVAASGGDKTVVEFAQTCFNLYIGGQKDAIPPNLRDTIFNVVASQGGMKEFEALMSIYHSPQSTDEKHSLMGALGSFKDEKVVDTVLSLLLDGTIRLQDFHIPMENMSKHRAGVTKLFSWIEENWDAIYELLKNSLVMLNFVIKTSLSGFSKMEQYKQVESFFANKDTSKIDKYLAQSLESIKCKANWVSRDSEVVKFWLKGQHYIN